MIVTRGFGKNSTIVTRGFGSTISQIIGIVKREVITLYSTITKNLAMLSKLGK